METETTIPLIVKSSIQIAAPAEVVWSWLVTPEKTKLYMFGCEARSNWQVGDTLLWVGLHEGAEMVFVKGKLLEIIPARLLRYSVIDTHAAYADIDHNYLQVQYLLEENDGQTTLTVIQDGFEQAEDGQKRYEETYNNGQGWQPILTAIKSLVEENS